MPWPDLVSIRCHSLSYSGSGSSTVPVPGIRQARLSTVGSFTNPEYAQVGSTEARARQDHDVVVTTTPFATTARPIIDGRTDGFCKIIVDRDNHCILGCHIVGERAVELAQVASVAIAADLPTRT